MCRFMLYKGKQSIHMCDLLTNPERSIVTQSYKSRERIDRNPLNGDGFGVGWYPKDCCMQQPCVFTSVTPAWNNRNLARLAQTVESPLFFAHVRAATEGLALSEANNHPFSFKQFMWMHNGSIGNFRRVNRRLHESLSDQLFNFCQGNTDSELAFAMMLNHLGENEDPSYVELFDAMMKTIKSICDAQHALGDSSEPSLLNFAVISL